MNWMLAAILICGASVFTSCTNDDNPVVERDLNVAEKIIGKWIVTDKNGHPAATNEKVVYNFTSATKAYLSASLNGHPDAATPWYDLIEADVVIEGNKVTLTMHPDEHIMSVHEYVITAINESEFTANLEVTVMKDGNMVLNQKVLFTLTKVKADYSAAILSYCLEAESMTIWKDVPGFLNADPKFFPNTVKIEQIPYNEAIELAYYGASVIHPKTVKPIQNKHISLHIKSFLQPDQEGSVIGPYRTIRPLTPLYIVKSHQVLLSVLPKDFSFIAEDNLQTIFAALAELNIRANLMQNSALSFSLCIDDNELLLNQLRERLAPQFRLRYNRNLQLITIRYYTQQIIDQMVAGRPILVQQRSRTTAQIVVGTTE